MTKSSDGAGSDAGRPNDGILISGAGVVGLTLGVALARAGLQVTLVGPRDGAATGRTVALLDGSVRMLSALGVWDVVRPSAAPLAVMRLVDDTGSLFGGPPVDFRAEEIGLPAFGFNIENRTLTDALEDVAGRTSGLMRIDGRLDDIAFARDGVTASEAGGGRLRVALLVGADGANSPTRAAAGIVSRDTAYPQVALTTILAHEAPHRDVSTEFHTREGPFTLVPMPPAPGTSHRSSLVWAMAPGEADRRLLLEREALAGEIDRQSRRMLGRTRIEGRVGRFPIRKVVAERLTGPRVALVGEAAHALPPIGAQGLNLSLRDAATLVDCLAAGRARGSDPGAPAPLDAYERSRRGDIALRAGGVDALNRSLLTGLLPVDLVRAGGLAALGLLGPARRAVMRFGLMPRHAIPSLMR